MRRALSARTGRAAVTGPRAQWPAERFLFVGARLTRAAWGTEATLRSAPGQLGPVRHQHAHPTNSPSSPPSPSWGAAE